MATIRQTSSGLAWNIICIRSCIISSPQPGYICRGPFFHFQWFFLYLLMIRRISRWEVAGQPMHVYSLKRCFLTFSQTFSPNV